MIADPQFEGKQSFILQTYVDYIKSAGARVVPIILEDDWEVTKAKLDRINGMLFPGGGKGGGYDDMGQQIFDYLYEKNEQGTYFPMFGICLGMQKLVKYAAKNKYSILGDYPIFKYLPLDF